MRPESQANASISISRWVVQICGSVSFLTFITSYLVSLFIPWVSGLSIVTVASMTQCGERFSLGDINLSDGIVYTVPLLSESQFKDRRRPLLASQKPVSCNYL